MNMSDQQEPDNDREWMVEDILGVLLPVRHLTCKEAFELAEHKSAEVAPLWKDNNATPRFVARIDTKKVLARVFGTGEPGYRRYYQPGPYRRGQ